jgi:hypothetical protein
LVKIYANVDHRVPPSGLVLRARILPLEALFVFITSERSADV